MSFAPTGRALSLVVLTVFLLASAACSSDDHRHQRGMMGQHLDTTRLQKIYDSVEEDYSRLMSRYESMGTQMPADLQQMVQHMQRMHGEASAMHRQMMRGRGKMHQDGMMGRGSGMMRRRGAREWDQQMVAMHDGMAQMHERADREQMAKLHRQMAERYRNALTTTPSGGASTEAPEPPEAVVDGATLYTQQCASCHGSQGEGGGGAFPPLASSEWATGDTETLIRVVLHGLQGRMQVGGTTYSGLMPGFGSRLSDREIAQILTYVRSSWGNGASDIAPEDVGAVRSEYSGRKRPWSSGAFE